MFDKIKLFWYIWVRIRIEIVATIDWTGKFGLKKLIKSRFEYNLDPISGRPRLDRISLLHTHQQFFITNFFLKTAIGMNLFVCYFLFMLMSEITIIQHYLTCEHNFERQVLESPVSVKQITFAIRASKLFWQTILIWTIRFIIQILKQLTRWFKSNFWLVMDQFWNKIDQNVDLKSWLNLTKIWLINQLINQFLII